MSMFDNLKSKLGIDTEADSYIDDTEDEIFAGGQGAPQQDYEQPEVKQHSNKVVNINATTQLQVVLVKPERLGCFHHRGPAQRQAHRRVEPGIHWQRGFPPSDRFPVRRGVCQQRPDQARGHQHLHHHPL